MASRRIAGITIEIDGNATKLNTALKSVDSQLAKTKAALRDTNKLLKLDPKNTELVTQKQKLLKQAIDQTKGRLSQLKSVQKESLTTEEWDALQREIAATETDLKSLEGEYAELKKNAGLNLDAISEKMKTVGAKFTEVGKTLTTKVTLPIVGAGTVAVSKYAEVDKTMALVNKTMGNSEEEAKMLNKAMSTAAANSTFGMSDAATASLNFARAGLKAEEAADILAPAMNLAAGEGGNLDTVSQGLVSTINGFGDKFSNAGEYADVFASACNNSALDVDSLSDSMGTAAPVFRTAGYSVKDAALYMGIMADNGIDANKSSKSLRTGLARLAKPPKDAAEALEDLGIEVFNADGSMKSSLEVQKLLNKSFSTLSEKEKMAAASAIFGKNQMAPWLALINTAPEDVNKLSTALDQSTGTTNEMAEAMMSGFGGSIEKLKSSIDVLMTTLGQLIAKYLQPVIDKLQKATEWFLNLNEGQQDMVVKIAAIMAAAGPLLIFIGKLSTGLGAVLGVVTKAKTAIVGAGGLKAALTGLAGGFNPVVLAIGAAVAAGVLIYKNWDKIKDAAGKLKKTIVKAWSDLKKNTKAAWDNIKKGVSGAWKNIKSGTSTAISAVKTTVSGAWTKIKTGTSTAWTALKTTVTTAASGLKTAVTTKFTEMKTALTTTATNIKTAVGTKFNELKKSAKEKWDAIKKTASEKWNGIKTTVTDIAGKLKTGLDGKLKLVKSAASTAWTNIKTTASTAWNGIKTTVGSKVQLVANNLKTKMNSAATAISTKWSTLKTNLASAVSGIASSVKTKFSTLKSNIQNAFSKIKVNNPFGDLLSAAKNVIGTIKRLFNITLSFPKFKLPHLNVTGKFSLNPPQVPKFDLKWYRKAYDQPYLFTSPTVLQTPTGMKGFGDGHGGEIVYGRDNLLKDIAKASGSGVVINVYASEGMDVKQLAREVQDEFVAWQRQNERAWA